LKLYINPIYNKFSPIMQRALDFYEGEDAVKSKKETYLPMLPGMLVDAEEGAFLYKTYLANASLFPAVKKTIEAYIGILFKKHPTIGGTYKDELFKNINYEGQSITQFSIEICKNILLNTRCAVLVDYPEVDTENLSLSDIKTYDIKPYAVFIPQQKIVDWQFTISNGLKELSSVTIVDKAPLKDIQSNIELKPDSDGYVTTARILTLENNGQIDVYVNRLYVALDSNDTVEQMNFELLKESVPLKNGEPFSYIPIEPCSLDNSWDLSYPPINDLVLLSIKDYKTDALYRDALLFLGRPIICMKGLLNNAIDIDDESPQQKIAIGTSKPLEFTLEGNCWVVGGTADATSALRTELDEIKKELSVVGSRALLSDNKASESQETAVIRRSGESGTINLIGTCVSETLTKIMRIMYQWSIYGSENKEDEYYFLVTADALNMKISSNDFNNLWQGYLKGVVPFQVLYNALYKSDLLPKDYSETDWKNDVIIKGNNFNGAEPQI